MVRYIPRTFFKHVRLKKYLSWIDPFCKQCQLCGLVSLRCFFRFCLGGVRSSSFRDSLHLRCKLPNSKLRSSNTPCLVIIVLILVRLHLYTYSTYGTYVSDLTYACDLTVRLVDKFCLRSSNKMSLLFDNLLYVP